MSSMQPANQEESKEPTIKEDSKEIPKQHVQESPNKSAQRLKDQSKDIQSKDVRENVSHSECDVKSIGNYTGLEGLNLREADALKAQNDQKQKCTCNCACDLCTNVRQYHDAKCLGIEYNLTNSTYLSYLNYLNNLNHIHDLKEHNLEHNFELDNFEDLIRLLPDSRVMIAIITFNMNDIYVIGVQEYLRDSEEIKELTYEIQATIGPTHVLLHDASFGVLHVSVFIRRELIWHVSIPEEDSLLCKLNPPSNFIRTKGAVAISFKLFGTSFLFVNNHLPAHQSKLQERIEEYNRMSTGLDLPRNLKSTLKRSYQSHDITNRFDCAFWFGDLNFRVDQDQETVLEEIALAKCEKDENNKHCFDSIFLHDQLSISMHKGEVLTGFEEAEVNFQPTYKYLINTNEYDEESHRIPSYTDRILYKNKRTGHITVKMYTAIQSIKSSDHKPVFGLFQTLLRPGVDDCPSNSGYFNHAVYVEGMKRLNVRRQTMNADHPERPRGLIANLKARKWFHSSVN